MTSIPYVTRLLSELAVRDAAYLPALGAAEALQMQLIFDGVVSRKAIGRCDDFSGRSTVELKEDIDNMLGAIMLAQRANLDNHAVVESLRNKFRQIPE